MESSGWESGPWLGSGPRSTVWLWTLGHVFAPFWPMDPIVEGTSRGLRSELAQITTGQICAQPTHASFCQQENHEFSSGLAENPVV